MSIEELVDLGRWVENAIWSSTSLSVHYDHPVAFRPLGKMFGNNGDGCRVCSVLSILGVLANGSYALCGIGETVPDFVFGQVSADPLGDIWNKSPVLLELREGLPQRIEGICSHCLMKGMCLGSCVAQNYYRSRSIWAPYWFCEEAYKQGLFPETRVLPKISKEEHPG